MKPIQAKDQVRLGLRRCLQLAISGMAFRLFRSGITTAILALAVAFLVHMLVYSLISHQTQRAAWEQLQESRRYGQMLTRMVSADPVTVILAALIREDPDRLAEYRLWLGAVEPAHLDELRATARLAHALEGQMQSLPPPTQAALLGGRGVGELLIDLQAAETFAAFEQTWQELSLPEPSIGWQSLRKLVRDQWPLLLVDTASIREGHQHAVALIAEAFPDTSVVAMSVHQPPVFIATVRQAGFVLEEGDLPALASFATRRQRHDDLTRTLENPQVRQQVLRRLQEVSMDRLLGALTSERGATWFMGVLQESNLPLPEGGAEALMDLARHARDEARLEQAALGYEPVDQQTPFNLPPRTLWLIALSMLVCIAGVANAMLMSVTERFTEIATMKCLGAMDNFVMMMFVFEAMIQGLLGGLIGLILGVLLAGLRGSVEYGLLIGHAVDVSHEILLAIGLSLVLGIALATLAAVGPAWVAARLAPMEAMRVD